MTIKHYCAVLFFFSIIIGIIIYIYTNNFEKNPSNSSIITTPTDKEICEARGGKWGIGSSDEGCNLPTSDAGEECSGSTDCEGACIAELSEEDWDKAINGTVYTKGKCAAWQVTVGCKAFVNEGKVEGILCLD